MFDTAQPYIAVYVIFRKNNEVAFLLRQNTNWMDGFYTLPAGKVEKNEPYIAAAIREAKEEVGVAPQEITHVLTAHRHNEAMDWVDVIFEAIKWEGELTNAEPDVHAELAWFDPSDLPENVTPPVKHYLAEIQDGNTYTEFGW